MDSLFPFRELSARLVDIDELEVGRFLDVPHILQDDHRWIVPAVHVAQTEGLLDKPCTVVMLDRHTDLEDCLLRPDELEHLRTKGTVEDLVRLCGEGLKLNPKQRITDGNWVKTGMSLGFFDHLVAFGVRRDEGTAARVSQQYCEDPHGQHYIELCRGRPVLPLQPRGALANFTETRLHQLLAWSADRKGCNFAPTSQRILLTIDLDCFIYHRKGDPDEPPLPWTKPMFGSEFLKTQPTGPAKGWTGQALLRALIQKAGLVVLSKETEMFGPGNGGRLCNAVKAEQRFRDVVFDGGLVFAGLTDSEKRSALRQRSEQLEKTLRPAS